MDQVKEYLQVALKYRFWILMAIAALLPVIAYFASAGDLAAQTETKVNQIKGSYEAAGKFASNSAPVNAQYKPLVESKTKVLRKDVNASWRKLYARQAPLMTWPSAVASDMNDWGRKWPEDLAPNLVYQTITNYVETYGDYVQEVYKSFKPFDFETGTGIIVAPPAEALLAPPTFTVTKPPSLGKVWDAQQRLWVQRTVLDVLAKVNERAGAKDWQTAPVKQLLSLAVATSSAQDQRSIAQGEALTKTEDVVQPGTEQPADEAAAGGGAGGADEMMAQMGKMGGAMMGGMGGPGGMGGNAPSTDFEILPSKNPNQAFLVPVHLSVYVEQERIPDLLVEFKNSPMNIEVLDFAMYKPEPFSVKKPKKGDQPPGGGMGGMGGMMGGMAGMMGGAGGMMNDMMTGGYGGMRGGMAGAGAGGYGASSSGYGGMRGGMAGAGAGGYGASSSGYGGQRGGMAGMMGGAGGMMGGPAGGAQKKVGVDIRQQQLQKRDEAKEKAKKGEGSQDEADDSEANSGTDPYYNVVRVDVYGKARFYLPPPKEEPAEQETTSPGAEPATADASTPAEPAQTTPTASGSAPAEGNAPAAETSKPADGAPADPAAPAAPADPAPAAPAPADAPAPPAPAGEPAPDSRPAESPTPGGTGSEAPQTGR